MHCLSVLMVTMSKEFLLYLASRSPRRRELLDQIGVSYELLKIEVNEGIKAAEEAEQYVLRLAQTKATSGLKLLQSDELKPVLAADTIVVCDGKIMGKPAGREEAMAMLSLLSGRSHCVMTAVSLVNQLRSEQILSNTTVTFRKLTTAEIQAYWNTGEPKDKAGAYAIQGMASMFIESLEGSYSAVVGLPVYETSRLLAMFGLDVEFIMQGRIA